MSLLFLTMFILATVVSQLAAVLHGAFNPICTITAFSSTSFCTALSAFAPPSLSGSSVTLEPSQNLDEIESVLRSGSNPFDDGMGAWQAIDELIVASGTINSSISDAFVERVADTAHEFRQMSLRVKPLISALASCHDIVHSAGWKVRRELSRDTSFFGPGSPFCALVTNIWLTARCQSSAGTTLIRFLDTASSTFAQLSIVLDPIVESLGRAEHSLFRMRTTISKEQNNVRGGRDSVDAVKWFSPVRSGKVSYALSVLTRLEEASNEASFALVEVTQRLVTLQSQLWCLRESTIVYLRSGDPAPEIVTDVLLDAVDKITASVGTLE
ncbi:hypothetical protein PLICRDRAFT_28102 [Plicaturopsis crispa FD-325 SS-3]|nr:hypothetical protein PLICRDRAFT_28102 [Plicaturopsis crispa FD-325 SS-3]